MESKHTPGPWDYDGQDAIGFEVFTRDESGEVSDSVGYVSTEEDARLIAAAPELLEALQMGVALIRGDAVGAEWKEGCADFVTSARAAISKATQS